MTQCIFAVPTVARVGAIPAIFVLSPSKASPIPVTSSAEDANPFVAACTLVIASAPSVVASTVSPSVFEKLVYFNAFSAISFDTLEFLNIFPSINEATACALPLYRYIFLYLLTTICVIILL